MIIVNDEEDVCRVVVLKKTFVKACVQKGLGVFGYSIKDVHNMLAHWQGKDICRNVNSTDYKRYALLCYITEPFVTLTNQNKHQNRWQAVAMARVLGEFGYDVDVIDYNRSTPTLTHNYDLVIDMAPGWYGSKVYEGFMNPGCKRIFYVTGSYPTWAAEQSATR